MTSRELKGQDVTPMLKPHYLENSWRYNNR